MSKTAKSPETITIPERWPTEVAFEMANIAVKVACRLEAVLVLLNHVEEQLEGEEDPSCGYTLATVVELVQGCQRDLRLPVTAGGAR